MLIDYDQTQYSHKLLNKISALTDEFSKILIDNMQTDAKWPYNDKPGTRLDQCQIKMLEMQTIDLERLARLLYDTVNTLWSDCDN